MSSVVAFRAAGVALILAICLAVGSYFDAVFLGPISDATARNQSLQNQVAALSAKETGLETALGRAPGSALNSLENLEDVSASPAIAAENFQGIVRDAVSKADGSTMSSQATTQKLDGAAAKVSVLLHARFDEMGLLKFTRAIEMGTPPMIFENLEVHPAPSARDRLSLDVVGVLTGFHADAR